ncbi:MAG: hypothetical protein P8X95_11935 [Anaerolineales bacterium]|jgi:hypothetical protein
MANETQVENKSGQQTEQQSEQKKTTVGENPVGVIGIVVMIVYLTIVALFLLYSLFRFWPTTPPGATPSGTASVNYFFWQFSLSNEILLLIIVSTSGALGSMVAALRSLYWYIGNRELVRSWIPMYILRPFVGATLALVFYLVIRGGFFSPGATIQDTSPFGFAALAALVGMFSEQAVLKLKEVAETLLTSPKPGEDAKPQEKKNGEG